MRKKYTRDSSANQFGRACARVLAALAQAMQRIAERAEQMEMTDPDFMRACRRYRAQCAEEDRIYEVQREMEARKAASEHTKQRLRDRRREKLAARDRRRERGDMTRQEVRAAEEERRQRLIERMQKEDRRKLVRETIQKALVRESRMAEAAPERVMFTHPKMLGDSPGPASYNPKPERTQGGALFTAYEPTEVRKVEQPRPGPGSYDPKKDGGPSYSFGALTGKKDDDPSLPGPGSYHHVPKPSKGGTISAHRVKSELEFQLERAAQQPGPGEYEHAHMLDKGRSSTISGRTRNASDFQLYQSSRRPGPGTYDPPEARVRGGVMALNSRKEASLPLLVPGPGSYYQTPTMKQEREMRELSKQVVKLVKTRGGKHARSAPEVGLGALDSFGGGGSSMGDARRAARRALGQSSGFEAIEESSPMYAHEM